MKIYLHIGLTHCGGEQIQQVLADKRDQLAKKYILYPLAPGRKNHTRLFMAMTDPDHMEPLRYNRGHETAQKQAELREKLSQNLQSEIAKAKPDVMILSCHQLSSGLDRDSELMRVRAFLQKFSDDITVVLHLGENASQLVAYYGEQIMAGRTASLEQELSLDAGIWAVAAAKTKCAVQPVLNLFPEVQAAPVWLDYKVLVQRWGAVFGKDALRVRPYKAGGFGAGDLMRETLACFDLPDNIGKVRKVNQTAEFSARTLARVRAVNRELSYLMEKGQIVPRQLQNRISKSLVEPGDPIDPVTLWVISNRFSPDNAELIKAYPALGNGALDPVKQGADWSEEDVGRGFKSDKTIESFQSRIDGFTGEHRKEVQKVLERRAGKLDIADFMSEVGKAKLPDAAKQEIPKLVVGRFKPHNNIGRVDETAQLPAYAPIQPRKLKRGSTGNVIVACMKNEAPYILEWIAYHQAIGVDGFIIYTNGCEDGTTEILDRLQDLGIVIHQDNNEWKGNSPQQAALNRAVKHRLLKNAEWVAHIDVDEFINIRIGNGTLPEFIDRIGEATNVAMTWRLFGHNGITKLADDLVIDQFDHAAPKFCPKPHTVWGFKTLYKNIRAYEKISCHRTTKLREGRRNSVHWVNGNGAAMKGSIADNGWRSSQKTIGYDMIQLNHYALRSAESYLIKRQRGRALHVNRSIGLSYWLRMDFNSYKDVTIKRNIERTNAALAVLKADDKLREWHQAGLEWHFAKAIDLHKKPEFEDLYQQALELDLNDLERVAWCLANDHET